MATVSINPVRPRRFLELVLMLLALAVGIGGYVITSINRTGELPANLGLHIGHGHSRHASNDVRRYCNCVGRSHSGRYS